MTEQEFLSDYDPRAFPQVAVTVDLVLMGVADGQLVALLQQRAQHPEQGKWALPGGFVRPEEGLEAAARRVLKGKAHIETGWLEQLCSFGDPERDPRMRIITVAYFALLGEEALEAAVAGDDSLNLADITLAEGAMEAGAESGGTQLPLAFDHAKILAHAVSRLRGKLDYAPLAFSLLPPLFTLRELQAVHEAILSKQLTKPPFRRRMIDQGWIEPTGEFETGTPYRPAELYRHKSS